MTDAPSTAPTAPAPADDGAPPLLRVEGLRTHFHVGDQVFKAVDGVDLEVRAGESVALVGESGSGKSVTALSILRLIPSPPGRIVDGTIRFDGTDLAAAADDDLRRIRGGRISVVFQDPMTSLNPLLTIGDQIGETIRVHQKVGRREAKAKAVELLDAVRIPDPAARINQYPHEMSGGQRQRVGIAMALANEPDLLIADEPTTALDVTVQAEILDLLDTLRRERGMALLFITHDFGVVSQVCDRVAVLYAGRIVEEAGIDEIFAEPLHPYTRRLIDCVPRLGQADRHLDPIPGIPPAVNDLPPGCAFAERCDVVDDDCRTGIIELTTVGERRVRCIRPGVVPAP